MDANEQPGAIFHDYEITVSPADIDENRHVNNVCYIRWVQEAATSHWESAVPLEITNAMSWVVVRHEIDYKKPAFLGEKLRVRTWIKTMSPITSERHCQVWRDSDGVMLARVCTLWCAINPATAKPCRIDPRVFECFKIEKNPAVEK